MNAQIEEMTKVTVSAIPVQYLSEMLPKVKYHLQKVVDASHGDITMQSIRNELIDGKSQLLVASRGEYILAAVTINVVTMDSGKRVLLAPVVGGVEMEIWLDEMIETLHRLAKEYCCDSVRGIGRAGWTKALKKYGWKPTMTIVEIEV